jgi:DNA modification methylase/transcriptional regulator with XRE-family HTH domain
VASEILVGDMREKLKELADDSIDSVVCDPPYHLTSIVKRFGAANAAPAKVKQTGAYARASKGFMGQTWDGGDLAFQAETWAEVWRVLKPGGHLVAFSGTRTYHRMAVAIEDAGFEVRDMIAWHYGSGFPKSLDVSKAIDKARDDKGDWKRVGAFLKAARLSRNVTARDLCARIGAHGEKNNGGAVSNWELGLACPTWEQWEQMRDALAFSVEMDAEVWRLNGRKGQPGEAWHEREVLDTKSYKIGDKSTWGQHANSGRFRQGEHEFNVTASATDAAREWEGYGTALKPATEPICLARKPLSEKSVAANVLKWGTGALNIDGCRIEGVKPQVTQGINTNASSFNVTKERRLSGDPNEGRWPANLVHDGSDEVVAGFPADAGDDSGSAARFFYCAKAGKLDRLGSDHPTVKPVQLMRWLVRLVTPHGGTVLDPFAGSGSTAVAAFVEGFDSIMIELREEAAADIRRRVDHFNGLGRITALEMAKTDEKTVAKARGDDLPLFGV